MGTMNGLKKIKILGAVLELPAEQHCQSSRFTSNWQCCLIGSSKTALRILIFSTAMAADNLFYVKFIATYEHSGLIIYRRYGHGEKDFRTSSSNFIAV